MYYLIRETLIPCKADEISSSFPYVAVLSTEQWQNEKENFCMGIDMDMDTSGEQTRAVVNFDSLTGTIAIPKMAYSENVSCSFGFALDEKGVVFIDDTGIAEKIIHDIETGPRRRMPGLERFLFDFLEGIVSPDLERLELLEQSLDRMEKDIISGKADNPFSELNIIRGDLLDLHLHYGQLMDLSQELWENENGFFTNESVRYFRIFTSKAERLRDMTSNLRDYTVQLRDLIQTMTADKQNRIITLLTVVTTIFTPLTLLTGWYGMNFRYMPELNYRWSYPLVCLLSLLIAGGSLIFFKKKKWL